MAKIAASHNQLLILKHLLSSAHGQVPINRYLVTAAIKSGSMPILQQLLDAGMDINVELGFMASPLHCATLYENSDAYIEWLFKLGADPNSALWGHGGGWSGLALASTGASIEVVRMFLSYGAKVRGSRALERAAAEGRMETVRLLIEEGGADVNEVIDPDADECTETERQRGLGTALHEAAWEGKVEVADFLLAKGANVGVRDSKRMTARKVAERAGKGEVVEVGGGGRRIVHDGQCWQHRRRMMILSS